MNGAQSTTATFNATLTAGPNVQQITVDGGPLGAAMGVANAAFTSVTVCVPGTTNCQKISGVVVDTGSYGLRVLSSALGTVSLPQEMSGSDDIVECAQFAIGVSWGPVKTADVKIAGEAAGSIPVQVIGDPSFPVPSSCSSHGTIQDTQATLGANGILGVGAFLQDCGLGCTAVGSGNPGFYYRCSSPNSCAVGPVLVTQQLQNPVANFTPPDNNGVIVELPSPDAAGAPSVSGFLVFGIGTQSNNGLGMAKVFTLDQSGDFTTVFNSQSYSSSFIDSGSNAVFFPGSGVSGLTTCPSPNAAFYCPASTINLQATNSGANGTSGPVNFSVANLDSFPSSDAALPGLGGPFFTSPSFPNAFDWGLPFFYGRNVYTAIEGQTVPGGTPPYWAY